MDSTIEPVILNDVQSEIKNQYLSSRKARETLDWSPLYSIEEGLAETIDWYKNNLRLAVD